MVLLPGRARRRAEGHGGCVPRAQAALAALRVRARPALRWCRGGAGRAALKPRRCHRQKRRQRLVELCRRSCALTAPDRSGGEEARRERAFVAIPVCDAVQGTRSGFLKPDVFLLLFCYLMSWVYIFLQMLIGGQIMIWTR